MDKAFFKDKINIIGLLLALAGAFILFPNYLITSIPALPPGPPELSLDTSWNLALSYAKIQHLTWGTQFVFTYGPLAQFCTRTAWEANKYLFLAFDIFMAVNYFMVFFLTFKQSSHKWATVLAIACIMVIFPYGVGASAALVLMGLLVFWIRISLDHPKPLYYGFQIAIVTLLFFIKFNTGLIVFILFYSGIVCNAVYRKTGWFLLATYAAVPLLLVVVLSSLWDVELASYIKGGIELVSGYNHVMYTDNMVPHSVEFMLAIVLLLVVTLVINLGLWRIKKQEIYKTLTIFFLFATPLYVLAKQAFVRGDAPHIVDFFVFSPFLVLCNPDLHSRIRYHLTKLFFVAALALPFYMAHAMQIPIIFKEKFSKHNYISHFKNYSPTYGMSLFLNGKQLPQPIKDKIGKQTVDVYPWNIQLLLENHLNYLPRPICQSYSAYTPYLENQNFEHYNNAATAPEFVLYEFMATDNRYTISEEPKVNLALHQNYAVVEMFDFQDRKMLLLQKKKDFRPVRLKLVNEYAMMLGSALIPKEEIYYEVEIFPTLKAKVIGLLDNAPEIRMDIQIKKGLKKYYKTSAPSMQTGIFSTHFMANTEDAQLFFNHQPNKIIQYYSFNPLEATLFKDKIRVKEYKIEQ